MSTPTPSDPSLRSHIAHVIADVSDGYLDGDRVAALIADPTLRAIIDLAALPDVLSRSESPEVRALLAAWRSTR